MRHTFRFLLTGALLSFAAVCTAASFEDAMAHYTKKEYEPAYGGFRRAAEAGDHSAQFNLGVMYLHGEFVAKDPIQAYAWMALAAQRNDKDWVKSRNVVFNSMTDDQRKQATAEMNKLYEQFSDSVLTARLMPAPGGAQLQSNVTIAHMTYRASPEYPVSMHNAMRSGSVELEFSVGADGFTKMQSVVWTSDPEFTSAAVEALKKSRFEPARMNGVPIEEFGLRTQFLFEIQGDKAGEEAISKVLDELRVKAEAGAPGDIYAYGTAIEGYEGNPGYSKPLDNPNIWYLRAAQKGNATAEFCLGKNLLYGNGVAPDAQKAVYWLETAATGRQSEAQYLLALELFSGARIKQDRGAAMIWLKRAAESGLTPAKIKAAWLYATSPDENIRDPKAAGEMLKGVPDGIIDQVSLMEAKAAAAAAQGDFQTAQTIETDAIKEARKYGRPDAAMSSRLDSYIAHKPWIETT